MSTRATIQRSVQPESILKRLPSRHQSFVDITRIGSEPVDLLIFEPGEGHVVTSKDLHKALAARASTTARFVAIGYDFTEEARAMVSNLSGLLFSERSFFGWTDERWYAIHQK